MGKEKRVNGKAKKAISILSVSLAATFDNFREGQPRIKTRRFRSKTSPSLPSIPSPAGATTREKELRLRRGLTLYLAFPIGEKWLTLARTHAVAVAAGHVH